MDAPARRGRRARATLTVALALLACPGLATAADARWSARDVGEAFGSKFWLANSGDVAMQSAIITPTGTRVPVPQNARIVGIRDDGAAFWYLLKGDNSDPGSKQWEAWDYGWLRPDGGVAPVNLGLLMVPDIAYGFHMIPEQVSGGGTVVGDTAVATFGFPLLAGWRLASGSSTVELLHRIVDDGKRVEQHQELVMLGVADDGRNAIRELIAFDEGTLGPRMTDKYLVDEQPSPRCSILKVSDTGRYLVEGPPCGTVAPTPKPYSIVSDPLYAGVDPLKGDLAVPTDFFVGWVAINRRDQLAGWGRYQTVQNGVTTDVYAVQLWDPGRGKLQLNGVLPADVGFDLRQAWDIDDKGRVLVTGLATADGRMHVYVLSPSISLTGILLDPSGAPRPDAPVTVDPTTPPESREFRALLANSARLTTRTDKRGRFSFEVAPGAYTVSTSVPGCLGPAKPCRNSLVVEAGLTDPPPVTGKVDAKAPIAATSVKAGATLRPSNGAVVVTLRCLRAAKPCAAAVSVTRRTGTTALAKVAITLKPGQKKAVRVPLTAAGKTALQGAPRVPARLLVTLAGKKVTTTIVLAR